MAIADQRNVYVYDCHDMYFESQKHYFLQSKMKLCSKLCIQDCRLSSGIENSQYVNQVHSVRVHTICQDMSVLQLMSILYILNDNFITKRTGSVTKNKEMAHAPGKNSDEPNHLQSLTILVNVWENVGHFSFS